MPNHNTLKLMRVHPELDLGAVKQVVNIKVSTCYNIPHPTEIAMLISWVKTTYINVISIKWIPKSIYYHTVAFIKALTL